jgi:hypothetical protein
MKKQTESESTHMIWNNREAAEAGRKKAKDEQKAMRRKRADIAFAVMTAEEKVEQEILNHGWLMAAYAVAVLEKGKTIPWLIKKLFVAISWKECDSGIMEPIHLMNEALMASAKVLNKRLERRWGKSWGKVNGERIVVVQNESDLDRLAQEFVAHLRWAHGVSEVQTNLGSREKDQKTWCCWTAAGKHWIATMYKPSSSDLSRPTLIIERYEMEND